MHEAQLCTPACPEEKNERCSSRRLFWLLFFFGWGEVSDTHDGIITMTTETIHECKSGTSVSDMAMAVSFFFFCMPLFFSLFLFAVMNASTSFASYTNIHATFHHFSGRLTMSIGA